MSHVTPSQANPSAPTPPTEAQQVTLEISDQLPSHLLYKYSMCTKDNLARAAGREKGVLFGGRRNSHLNMASSTVDAWLQRSRLKVW